jgi:hypothetical protein
VSRHRTITAGSSFGGNPLACTVGLGRAEAIRALVVSWPTSRTRQTFRGVPIDAAIEITEGREEFRVVDAPPIAPPWDPPRLMPRPAAKAAEEPR